jgi:hypothetical protein
MVPLDPVARAFFVPAALWRSPRRYPVEALLQLVRREEVERQLAEWLDVLRQRVVG